MIIRDVINYTGGTPTSLTGREYLSPDHNDTLVVALHCDDMKGPADGSQLDRLESIDWWPKFARTVNYPFNLFAVQVSGITFHFLLKDIIKAMKTRYNPKNIVLLGCGRGAFDVYNILSENTEPEIKLIINISGGSDRSGSISRWPKVRGLAWHGVSDPRYPISAHREVVQKYNDTHGAGRIQLNELSGVGYDAWEQAFSPDPSKDQSLQFVISQLQLGGVPPVPEDPRIKELEAEIQRLRTIITETLNELK